MAGMNVRGVLDSQATLLGITAVLGLGAIATSGLTIPALTVGTNVTYGLIANKIGALCSRLRQCGDSDVLRNQDLAKAAGRTVARALVETVSPKHPEIKQRLKKFADHIEGYWVQWVEAHQNLKPFATLREDQLHQIFAQQPEQFAAYAVLPEEQWREVVAWLFEQGCEGGGLPDTVASYEDVIEELAAELTENFNKHLRQVLKDDAHQGGKAFVGMLFDLHGATLAKITEIQAHLPKLATCEDLRQLLQALETGMRDELAQIRELLQQYLDPQQARLPIPQHCDAIIEEKTRDFVGRGFVFEAIRDFLRNRPKGYFVLEADPGVGKSAIMARLVQLFKGGCLVHFNTQGTGIVKPEQFLENICTQLIESYHLDYPRLPERATEDGNVLIRLLTDAAQKLMPGKKLVVVVDALNEVDASQQIRGSNLLYLPDVLPDQVYFVMSKRPQSLKLPLSGHLHVFDLMQYPAESVVDARRYAEQRYGNSALIQAWVAARQFTPAQFLTDLVARSENNFMYLRYVLNDIEEGLYASESLESVSRGLRRYYQKHWDLMGMLADPLPIDKIRTIYVLALVREAVSLSLLAELTELAEHQLRPILRQWEQFLRLQLVGEDRRYTIYHAVFRDFLRKEAEETGVDLADIQGRVADDFTQAAAPMMTALGQGLTAQIAEQQSYLLHHQLSHFVDVGDGEQLRVWLTNFGFLQQKLEAVGISPLIDDYDRVLPLVSGEEQQALTLIQDALRLSAHVLEQDHTQLAGQLLGRLLSFDQSDIVRLLAQAQQWCDQPWFRPLQANLTWPLIRTFTGHCSEVTAVAIAPDGKRAVSASYDHTLKLWDLEQGTALATLTGHTLTGHTLTGHTLTGHSAVAITPNGKRAVSALWDKTLKLWDLEQGTALVTLIGHSDLVNAVAITPDGKRAVSASGDKTLKLWDLETGKELATLSGHSGWVRAVAITPDGKRALSGSCDQTLKLWDLETGKELATRAGHSDWVTAVAITPDGKRALSGSRDATLKLWYLGTALNTFTRHSRAVTAVAIAPDGKRALSGSHDQTLKLWDLETGKELATLSGHSSGVTAVAIAPDGKRALSASFDGTLKLWDLETGQELVTLSGHSDWVAAVAITPDGKCALSTSFDQALKLWDLETGQELAIRIGHSDWVTAVAITPDGKHALCAYSDEFLLKLRTLKAGRELVTLSGHSDWVEAVAIAPDGKRALSASQDKTLKLWDLETGQELATLTRHSNWVEAVAITPDGKCAISASMDKTLKLWNLATGEALATFTGEAEMSSCAIAPDGVTVVAGDESGRVYFLRLEGV
ncbi:hypothetical protein PN441_11355 [Spirulina major CS-329]|uniref:hypothetical protein n=1 Tax=Spirulina major TaxID=270636 RepID=UPI002330C3BC|nr:hypothetical protein [Spirulina major]MDB9503668.1 hypothetical protein [Spirulina major CS-329]